MSDQPHHQSSSWVSVAASKDRLWHCPRDLVYMAHHSWVRHLSSGPWSYCVSSALSTSLVGFVPWLQGWWSEGSRALIQPSCLDLSVLHWFAGCSQGVTLFQSPWQAQSRLRLVQVQFSEPRRFSPSELMSSQMSALLPWVCLADSWTQCYSACSWRGSHVVFELTWSRHERCRLLGMLVEHSQSMLMTGSDLFQHPILSAALSLVTNCDDSVHFYLSYGRLFMRDPSRYVNLYHPLWGS